MDAKLNSRFINQVWDESIIPTLMDYIKIPNKSPHFDRDWYAHGHMTQAMNLIASWCKAHAIENMTLSIIQEEQRTPLLFIDIPGSSDETVLLYGHLDKQPEMSGWDPDLHPWQPVLRTDRLYGRGVADDGYAAFAALLAIKSLREQNIPHARCVILIEASEESGSPDLPFYIQKLQDQIGQPSLIVCLDSGCGNYDQLWLTTSLRGLIGATLQIEVLKQGVHSGLGSGVTPSPLRILRQLLDRIENNTTGDILLSDLQVDIPSTRLQQTEEAARILSQAFIKELPFSEGVEAESANISELILRRTWKPALSITGCDGIPAIENAGNVTLPSVNVKLSMRLPPTCDPQKAAQQLKTTLEKNPPYHAKVTCQINESSAGWHAPLEHPWLTATARNASQLYFGQAAAYIGEGGSIPFMGMLEKQFPKAQFLITGLLGPGSNAHGPNEFLHIPTGKKLTACVAQIIAEQYARGG